MTRARFVLGEASLRQRFDEVKRSVITSPRDTPALRNEIVAMREKVRAAHPCRIRDTVSGLVASRTASRSGRQRWRHCPAAARRDPATLAGNLQIDQLI